MNLSDLISDVARRTCRPRTEADRMCRAMIEAMRAGLNADGRVEVFGFGVLESVETAPKRGRDWSSGKAIDIPAGRKIMFRESRSLATGPRNPWNAGARRRAGQARPRTPVPPEMMIAAE